MSKGFRNHSRYPKRQRNNWLKGTWVQKNDFSDQEFKSLITVILIKQSP